MKSATISTGQLAYVDRGAGQPVLLIHGFPLDHTMWDAVVAQLVTEPPTKIRINNAAPILVGTRLNP